jgi:hypothetical protein
MRLSPQQPSLRAACLLLALAACADDDSAVTPEVDAGAPTQHTDAAEPSVGTADAAVGALDAGTPRDAASAMSTADGAAVRDAASGASDATSERPDAPMSDADARAPDAGARDASVRDAAVRDASLADAATDCPAQGAVRYTLQMASMPSSAETMAYTKIRAAMDKAIEKYNCYTNLSREVRVSYDPGVPTADGNENGNMRFGSDASMHFVTAMHELGHVFGVGGNAFKTHVQDGVFNGSTAQAELRRVSGDPAAKVSSDGTHFWPYGLNYVTEYKSEADLVGHCALVVAIRKDLGL